MRKFIALIIPLIVLFTVVNVFWVFESNRTPDWEMELDRYFAQTAALSETVTMQAVVPARHPQNFAPDMADPVETGWPWGGIDLPPPTDIKCVILERTYRERRRTNHRRELVLVSYQTDHLWHQGWLVQEVGELAEPTTGKILNRLGCDFEPRFLDDLT